ncbi:MAG: hypothetical protein NC248_12295 [Bacteroides sp.]|nr:hypothetical protein [Bacteroides sp.]MCM1391108.1 hypothetical protein [Bacteroides sp.]
MNSNIEIYGSLTITVSCECCGMMEEVRQEVCQNDWLTGYDIDITIFSQEIIDKLTNYGWKEVNDKLLCPDCVTDECL